MATTMDRRSFLKRIALGAIATLVAPGVLARAASAQPALKPVNFSGYKPEDLPKQSAPVAIAPEDPSPIGRGIVATDFGQVELLPGESAKEAAARAAEDFSRGVPTGGPGVLPAAGSTTVGGGVTTDPFFYAYRPGYWHGPGTVPSNEVSDVISYVERAHRKISQAEFDRRMRNTSSITVPLVYGSFMTSTVGAFPATSTKSET